MYDVLDSGVREVEHTAWVVWLPYGNVLTNPTPPGHEEHSSGLGTVGQWPSCPPGSLEVA